MIGMSARVSFDMTKPLRQERKATLKALGHAGGYIRKVARSSIKRRTKTTRKGASLPGTPPHTKSGQLKRSILYAVDRKNASVVIGPTFSGVGTSAAAHEYGGRYKKQRYPARPFMGPALKKSESKLPEFWKDSIK